MLRIIHKVLPVVVVLVLTYTINAQPEKITPQLIESFVEHIEQNALPISDYLSNSKEFSIYVKTLKLTDQFDALKGKQSFTIFAPTNEAFEQFPTEVLKELFQPSNKEKLKSIVTYHIINGKLRGSDILKAINNNGGEAQFNTLNGLNIRAYYDRNDLFIKDDNGYSIKMIQQNMLQSNGIVYKIDTVILPRVDDHLPREN